MCALVTGVQTCALPICTTIGFALSVLATSGILLLGPGWSRALANWMPMPAAQAIAVPTAAQLACTPIVAAISGQVSLVAVLANPIGRAACRERVCQDV